MAKTPLSKTAFRGFGGPQGMIVIEDILDRIARTLGIEPHLVRERNFYREGDRTHYDQPVKDAERMERIWDQLRETSSFDARRAEIAQFNATSRHVKRGIAITPVKFGISFNRDVLQSGGRAGADVPRWQRAGKSRRHGDGPGAADQDSPDRGDRLGVPIDVRVMPTRTDKVPNTSATAASSGSDINGGAVKNACDQIRERLATVAAGQLGVHPDDVRFTDGIVTGIGFLTGRSPGPTWYATPTTGGSSSGRWASTAQPGAPGRRADAG